jgi:uncharacterized membrane protein YqjE
MILWPGCPARPIRLKRMRLVAPQNINVVNLLGLILQAMLKAILIGLTFAVLVDQAAFDGVYRDQMAAAAVVFAHGLIHLDWKLTHT